MKKVFKYLAIVIGIILLIMIVAPLLFKDQIVSTVKKEVNKQVNATVDFDNDISLGFFRNFPNASLGIKDLSVVGKDRYDGDTLAYVNRLHVVIDLFSLFGGDTYQIRNVSLTDPFIQLLVDSLGYANWDIAKEDTTQTTDTSTSSFKVALQKYAIHNGYLIYSDSTMGFLLKAEGLDHAGKGDFTQDVFDLQTSSHAQRLTVAYGGIPYLNGIETDIDAGINIDLPQSKYTFNKSKIKLNGLVLGADGYVALPNEEDIDMNIAFKANEADFKNFLSLIPAIYQKNFDQLEASGDVAFDGFVKGVYNENRIPAFGLNMSVDNGKVQYSSVPEPVKDVHLQVNVKNEDGDLDHTFINVKQLHFLMGSNPFDAHLTVQNIQSNPTFDGAVKGKLNLSEVSKFYPLEKGTDLEGLLNMDVKASGDMNAVNNKQYDKFKADGQITAQNIIYSSDDLDQEVKVPQGTLSFSPQQVKVSDVTTQIGKSDIAADGGLDNLFGYLFGKEVLKGRLDVRSQLLDLNDMMGADAATTSTTSATSDTTSQVEAVITPQNIDFKLTTKVNRFIYDNYDLENVRGNVEVANGVLTIHNLSANMLDGSAQFSGTYDTRQPDKPKTDIDFKVNDIDISKAFKTFNTIQALAPVASFVQGDFSGDLSLSTVLNEKLYPVLTSVNSLADLQVPNFNIKGFEPLQELAAKLGIPKLKDMDIGKLFLQFKIDSGFLKVKPFDFKVDDIDMKVAGKNGLNQVIDYTIQMDIPREKLGNVNNELTSLIAKANNAISGNIDLGETIPVKVHLGGTLTNPDVKLDFSAAKSQVEASLKSEAKQKLNQGASKLLDQLTQSGGSASKPDSTQQESKAADSKKGESLKEGLKKGLKGLLNRKKDTGE